MRLAQSPPTMTSPAGLGQQVDDTTDQEPVAVDQAQLKSMMLGSLLDDSDDDDDLPAPRAPPTKTPQAARTATAPAPAPAPAPASAPSTAREISVNDDDLDDLLPPLDYTVTLKPAPAPAPAAAATPAPPSSRPSARDGHRVVARTDRPPAPVSSAANDDDEPRSDQAENEGSASDKDDDQDSAAPDPASAPKRQSKRAVAELQRETARVVRAQRLTLESGMVKRDFATFLQAKMAALREQRAQAAPTAAPASAPADPDALIDLSDSDSDHDDPTPSSTTKSAKPAISALQAEEEHKRKLRLKMAQQALAKRAKAMFFAQGEAAVPPPPPPPKLLAIDPLPPPPAAMDVDGDDDEAMKDRESVGWNSEEEEMDVDYDPAAGGEDGDDEGSDEDDLNGSDEDDLNEADEEDAPSAPLNVDEFELPELDVASLALGSTTVPITSRADDSDNEEIVRRAVVPSSRKRKRVVVQDDDEDELGLLSTAPCARARPTPDPKPPLLAGFAADDDDDDAPAGFSQLFQATGMPMPSASASPKRTGPARTLGNANDNQDNDDDDDSPAGFSQLFQATGEPMPISAPGLTASTTDTDTPSGFSQLFKPTATTGSTVPLAAAGATQVFDRLRRQQQEAAADFALPMDTQQLLLSATSFPGLHDDDSDDEGGADTSMMDPVQQIRALAATPGSPTVPVTPYTPAAPPAAAAVTRTVPPDTFTPVMSDDDDDDNADAPTRPAAAPGARRLVSKREVDAVKSLARGMLETEAAESDDEFMGLGGADGEDDEDDHAMDLDLIAADDDPDADKGAAAVRELAMQQRHAEDEAATKRLEQDLLLGGGLGLGRRARMDMVGKGYGLEDLDDEEGWGTSTGSSGRRHGGGSKRRRGAMAKDMEKLAENPATAAFARAFVDVDDAEDFVGDEPTTFVGLDVLDQELAPTNTDLPPTRRARKMSVPSSPPKSPARRGYGGDAGAEGGGGLSIPRMTDAHTIGRMVPTRTRSYVGTAVGGGAASDVRGPPTAFGAIPTAMMGGAASATAATGAPSTGAAQSARNQPPAAGATPVITATGPASSSTSRLLDVLGDRPAKTRRMA
ncbi:hypothetical protein AMAG_07365 [Allomyces macrogynus ATCC 38327]|uniref:DNA replication checkpoint mediator MRC1 domain-containing protein n=1 Tax=Allomyces macrogynus (strain ATCC 38327) TaxID=578462 RepID=A0A0L0SHX0_ALLM3|nr:hypothetical protein AMAG_07365 [Allomyces macrogynus ATCC 38327]|eukprot:KNE62118.1 hypothetical protein AMAG_07365 [Allomyces macrogynus ATCC 38327]